MIQLEVWNMSNQTYEKYEPLHNARLVLGYLTFILPRPIHPDGCGGKGPQAVSSLTP